VIDGRPRPTAARRFTKPPRRRPLPQFDFIRLVAASSVIFSHAFQISEGTDENEPLVHLLGAHNIAGIYGVFIFFKRGPQSGSIMWTDTTTGEQVGSIR
jgi:hypothetical protein